MKNSFWLLFGILIFSSCEKEENSYHELNAEQQGNLRRRQAAKCVAENAESFKNLKKDSNSVLFSDSTRYGRDTSFRFKYFDTKTPTVFKQEGTLQVWKQNPAYTIFYVRIIEGTNYFLRVTKIEQDKMVTDLASDFCQATPVFKSKSNRENGPASFAIEYTEPAENNLTYLFNDAFLINFDEPVFFANYDLTRTRSTRDASQTVTATTTFKTSLEAGGLAAFNSTNHADFPGKFCNLIDGGTFRVAKDDAHLGYAIEAEASCDVTAAAAGWDMSL